MAGTLHKLTAGDGYLYLTRQVAVADSTELGKAALADYYSAQGEAPGRWLGQGVASLETITVGDQVTEAHMVALFGEGRHPDAERIIQEAIDTGASPERALAVSRLGSPFKVYDQEPTEFVVRVTRAYRQWLVEHGLPRGSSVPDSVRAEIRTRIGRETFAEMYGRDPLDGRELAAHLVAMSRPRRQAVAGFDMTFSPVKSVSALWAVAPRPVSEQIEQAHQDAVEATLAWVEREVAYTRRGADGVRQVDIRGLLATVFTHRDSRAGDPDLHTHVAISNKVQALDGKWLAVDGQMLYRAMVAASERYNTLLERTVAERLGVRFADRDTPEQGRRAVREILGVDRALTQAWSTRRAHIDARRTVLAHEFEQVYGRAPTPKEATALAQQATLETREDKKEPRSLAEQRAAWREQARTVLGSEQALEQMLERTLGRGPARAARLSGERVADLAGEVLYAVVARRATFQWQHLVSETQYRLRGLDVPAGEVDRVEAEVLNHLARHRDVVALTRPDGIEEPALLRRRDGQSQYVQAHSQLATTAAVLEAEAAIVATAKRRDGRVVDARCVALSLLESAANGLELNPAQAQMVTEMATSGARVQLALAPAGSGKTTAMRALARAWQEGGGSVVGLAPTAVAAAELGTAIGAAACDTLAKLTFTLHASDPEPPAWMRQINHRALLIIDEAGMAGTLELRAAIDYVVARGGSVRLVGDDQQLAAVAAGGVLRDIKAEVGAVTLSELVRFGQPDEAAATLALRDGLREALGFYVDRGRVHQHDEATVTDGAYQAWRADRAQGRSSLLMAHRVEIVDQLNARARADRLAEAETSAPAGPVVELARGLSASAGDSIVTRRNDRRLRLSATHWVKNGDRFTLTSVTADGAIQARHDASGRRITLPAEYVRKHVDLGYASTIHGAQGTTVDVSHTLLTGAESRQLAYVAATRGRLQNHFYVAPAGDGDPHKQLQPQQVSPITAVEVLERILERDGSQLSARTELAADTDPAARLAAAAARYDDGVRAAAVSVVGPERMRQISAAAEQALPGLTDEPAWDTLAGHLAILDLAGDAIPHLQHAISRRELDSAIDKAAVLVWRLDGLGERGGGPLPWLSPIPSQLRADPMLGPWLMARADLVRTLAADVRTRARTTDPAAQPAWAHPFLDAEDLRSDLALWRAAYRVPDADPDPAGPPTLLGTAAVARYRRDLNARVDAHLGSAAAPGARWRELATRLDAQVTADPWWPVLGRRLDVAAAGGLDVAALLSTAVAARPLPTEHTAAALWSRLSTILAPAVAGTAGSGASRLRPDWTDQLAARLPGDALRFVMTDRAWPAFVAVVDQARREGTDVAALLGSAVAMSDLDPTGRPAGGSLDQLATILTWRVSTLTSPPPAAPDDGDLIDSLYDPEIEHGPFVSSPATGDSPGITPADAPPVADPGYTTDLPPTQEEEPPAADEVAARTSRERIVQINELAMAEWESAYAGSPAADYVRARLGTDLIDDDRFRLGYAPAAWSALSDRLRAAGVTDAELVDAGLSRWSRRGTLIDTFRDRVVFAVHDPVDGALVGFAARANPSAGTDVPKYLNTAATPAFTKGAQLFGWAETRADRARGAQAVRVEGAMDALAVTLAGAGHAVGLAPMGTALTDTQADLLAQTSIDRPLLVATDPDLAGRRAAEQDYWTLTSRGVITRTLDLPYGVDPAELWRTNPQALRDALTGRTDATGSLAERVALAHVEHHAGGLAAGHVEALVHAARRAAGIIAAQPPTEWDPLVEATAAAINTHSRDPLPRTELVYDEVLRTAIQWSPTAQHDDIQPEHVLSAQARLRDIADRLRQQRPSPARDAALAAVRDDIDETLQSSLDRLLHDINERPDTPAPQKSSSTDSHEPAPQSPDRHNRGPQF